MFFSVPPTVVDGAGIVINVDVLDVNKASSANCLLTRKDLVAGKLTVPFLVRLLSTVEMRTAVGRVGESKRGFVYSLNTLEGFRHLELENGHL